LSIGSGIPATESAGSDFLIVSFRNVICRVGFSHRVTPECNMPGWIS
jgi:hypothetical protein